MSTPTKPICLIRPPAVSFKFDLSITYPPPIGLAYLNSTLKKNGYRTQIVDAVGIDPNSRVRFGKNVVLHGISMEECCARIDAECEVIGITVPFSLHWPSAKYLIRLVRARFPKAKILIGGEHATALPDFCLQDCPELDFCISGEGEGILLAFLSSLESGSSFSEVDGLSYRDGEKIITNKRRGRLKELDKIPWPDWSDFPMDNYHRFKINYGVKQGVNMPIMASRGCPYSCTFCSNPKMWTTRWMVREVDDVIAEMRDLRDKYGAIDFSFYDLTAIVQKDWILEFCKKFDASDLHGSTYQLPSGTRSEALDKEVCHELHKTGCRYLVYAPESASTRTLKLIKKRISPEKLYQSMKDAVDEQIVIRFNIVIGFPFETRRDIYATMLYILKAAWLGATDVFVNIYSPYPGSELFDDLTKRGKIGTMNDDYFHSLEPNNVFSIPVTQTNEHIGIWELLFYRTMGYGLFYFAQYALKPSRILKTIRNIQNNKSTSAVENFLHKLLTTIGLKKVQQATAEERAQGLKKAG